MIISVLALNATTLCANDHSLALPIAAEAGLKAVELTAGKCSRALITPDMTKDALNSWKKRLQTYGLFPLALGAHRNLTVPDECSDFEKLMEKAQSLGCQMLTTAVPDGCNKQRFMDGLAQVCRRAEVMDMRIVLETHGNEHGTGRSLLPFLEVSPRVSICYDTANVLFYSSISPLADLPCCIDQVSHLHLKDKAGPRNAWDFPALGKGTVDFPALFALPGWREYITASIEVEFTPAGVTSEQVRKAVLASVNYLETLPHGVWKK